MEIKKVWKNRGLAVSILLGRIRSVFGANPARMVARFDTEKSEFSESRYLRFVSEVVYDYSKFMRFKRHPDYNLVLEHLSYESGCEYLRYIQNEYPDLGVSQTFKNMLTKDDLGAPRKYFYRSLGMDASPTTLRYLKVVGDIRALFGPKLGQIAEIGGGYGGQAVCLDSVLEVEEYSSFDMFEVNHLVAKYLNHFTLNCKFRTRVLNEVGRNDAESYDLVISNYAFSELPLIIQTKYLERVVSRSRGGYITINSGRGGQFEDRGVKMSVDVLKEKIPGAFLVAEEPSTSPSNAILVWGPDISQIPPNFRVIED